MDDNRGLVVLLILVALFAFGGDGSPLSPSAVTAVTYVYEKDEAAVPSEVMAGLDRLNREKKVVATMIDDDVKNGNGETPAQYAVPIEAAKKDGLPILVATNGATVVRVVKNPKTEAEVVGIVP